MAAARHLSYYGSLGSQELLDGGGDDDSVFTNEDNILPGDSVSMVDSNGGGGGGNSRLEMPRPPPVRGASVFRDHQVQFSVGFVNRNVDRCGIHGTGQASKILIVTVETLFVRKVLSKSK